VHFRKFWIDVGLRKGSPDMKDWLLMVPLNTIIVLPFRNFYLFLNYEEVGMF
jgi:hypothetical protein